MTVMPEQSRAQRERLFFVEFSILFLGKLQRKDLIRQFGISEAAATKDLSLYAKFNPEILSYDFRQKCYQFTHGKPKFPHSVDQALFTIAGDQNIAQSVERHPARLTSYVGVSIKRHVSIDIAAALTRGMYRNRSIRAIYRSISGGERERLLTPLALIHDGLRWHIRCFDQEKIEYRDYNLARFISVIEESEAIGNLEDDSDWNKWVELELSAHPKSKHPETIRLDYDIDDRCKKVKLRSCLVGYFLRYWPIDYSDEATENPLHYQLYLLNKKNLIQEGVSEWALS